MARGKIQIKKIQNSTNRQVTFSKRRKGLFKKADELSVLCDAKVSIIIISSTHKLHEYISPSISTKEVYDLYQKNENVDLWSNTYERMKDQLKNFKELNGNLKREIRRRMGECLDDLNFEELCSLEEKMDESVTIIRQRKIHIISRQIDNLRKKIRNGENVNRTLVGEFELRGEDPGYLLIENGVDYETAIAYSNGLQGLLALSLQPNQPNRHSGNALL